MRLSAFFILAYSIISKDGLICAVPLQSVFFVLALTKSGILGDLSGKDTYIGFSNRGIFKGALCIMLGFALSLFLIILLINEDIYGFSLLSLLVMSLYFCFFGLHAIMLLLGKESKKIKNITIICTLFPCIASISGFKGTDCLPITLILLVIGSILFYISLAGVQKKNADTKKSTSE